MFIASRYNFITFKFFLKKKVIKLYVYFLKKVQIKKKEDSRHLVCTPGVFVQCVESEEKESDR